MCVLDLISSPASSGREATRACGNGRQRRSCLELNLVGLNRTERRKIQEEKKGIFSYLPKSTLTGFTGLDSRFSLLSCRVSSWDHPPPCFLSQLLSADFNFPPLFPFSFYLSSFGFFLMGWISQLALGPNQDDLLNFHDPSQWIHTKKAKQKLIRYF